MIRSDRLDGEKHGRCELPFDVGEQRIKSFTAEILQHATIRHKQRLIARVIHDPLAAVGRAKLNARIEFRIGDVPLNLLGVDINSDGRFDSWQHGREILQVLAGATANFHDMPEFAAAPFFQEPTKVIRLPGDEKNPQNDDRSWLKRPRHPAPAKIRHEAVRRKRYRWQAVPGP